jgi:predicted dehydrogenase
MPLRLCVIGAGHMGKIHAGKLASMKDVSLAGIVDVSMVVSQELAQRLGVPASDTLDVPFMKDVQGAVVASTTDSHFEMTRALMNRGIHVFIEKPITSKTKDAEKLIAMAKEKGLVLQVGHLERLNPPFRKALQFISQPLFIETRRTSGFTGRSTDIDVVTDLMIHDIDLVLSLKKNIHISSIEAHGVRIHTKSADLATARIEFSDETIATLTASRASLYKERALHIIEKDRHISVDLASGTLVVHLQNGKERIKRFSATKPDPVRNELRAFVKAIRGTKEVPVTGEDGLRALLVAKQISANIESQWS